MKKFNLSILVTTFQLLTMPTAFAASPGHLKTVGITEGDRAVAQLLLEKEVRKYPAREETIGLMLVQLKSKILMEVFTEKGGSRGGTRETTINSVDELDIALSRTVEALLENKSLKETAARGRAIGQELRSSSKVRSIQGFQVSVGTAAPMTHALKTYSPMGSLALSYSWDLDPWIVETRGDWIFGFGDGSGHMLSTSIGGHYVFISKPQYAVFSGMDLGFGTLRMEETFTSSSYGTPYTYTDTKNYAGSVVGANVGVILLRHADVNFEIRGRVAVLTREVNKQIPLLGGVSLGVRF